MGDETELSTSCKLMPNEASIDNQLPAATNPGVPSTTSTSAEDSVTHSSSLLLSKENISDKTSEPSEKFVNSTITSSSPVFSSSSEHALLPEKVQDKAVLQLPDFGHNVDELVEPASSGMSSSNSSATSPKVHDESSQAALDSHVQRQASSSSQQSNVKVYKQEQLFVDTSHNQPSSAMSRSNIGWATPNQVGVQNRWIQKVKDALGSKVSHRFLYRHLHFQFVPFLPASHCLVAMVCK